MLVGRGCDMLGTVWDMLVCTRCDMLGIAVGCDKLALRRWEMFGESVGHVGWRVCDMLG